MSLRTQFKQWLRKQGYDVTRFTRLQQLRHHRVDLILDVGASVGLYGEQMRRLGYTGRIVSFEPRTAAFQQLSERAARDADWHVRQCALGSEPATSEIHISKATDSSSLLDMLPRHVEACPDTEYVDTETIQVDTLSRVFDDYVRPGETPFLKLDVQGFEMPVLEGAADVLDRLAGLQIELSLVPLYSGETLLPDVVRYLGERGFTLTEIEPGLRDPGSHQLLQVDGLFFRLS